MAIFHFSAKAVQRSGGRSSTGAAAYRAGERIEDLRTGIVHDFTRKGGVAGSWLVMPGQGVVPSPEAIDLAAPVELSREHRAALAAGYREAVSREPATATMSQAPTLARAETLKMSAAPVTREAFWNAVELHHKRGDAVVAREIEAALPAELSEAGRQAVVLQFAKEAAERYGVGVDVAIHRPHKKGDERNHHTHMLLSACTVSESGELGKKCELLDPIHCGRRGIPNLTEWGRARWAELCNQAMEREGISERIDHRSHAERGIELEPTQHVGVHATAMARKGMEAERSAELEATRQKNAEAIRQEPEKVLAAITSREAVFTRHDIARELNRYIDDPQEFQTLLARLEQSPALVELAPAVRGAGGQVVEQARYSTLDMVRAERGMADATERMNSSRSHGVASQAIAAAVQRAGTLTNEQRAAVEHILDGRQIAAVIGDAGTGKSFSMKVAREAWEAAGYRVIGAALAGKAADGLQEGAGIESRTLHSWELTWQKAAEKTKLHDAIEASRKLRHHDRVMRHHTRQTTFEARHARWVEHGRKGQEPRAPRALAPFQSRTPDTDPNRLTSKTVLVIDEAGMVGSRQLARVIAAAEKAGAKVVLVGDEKQLQAVEAGAPFRAIVERIGAAEITEIRRQKEDWAKTASMALARGAVKDGLDAYQARGHVRMAVTRDDARRELVADYLAARRAGGSSIVLAHSNVDVQALNEAVRAHRREAGELGDGAAFATSKGPREFAVGDRLVFLKNDRALGVKNGMLGTVEQAEAGRLAVRLDNGERREVKQDAYQAIDHGYAVTVHKSQGVTVDRAFVLASKGMDKHLAYVAMTRHREAATLYAGQDDFRGYEAMAARLGREQPKASTLDYDTAAFADRRGFDGLAVVRHLVERGRQLVDRLKGRLDAAAERLGLTPTLTAGTAREAAQAAPWAAQGRVDLVVPFMEKDQAKAAGARFDGEAKRWYAPAGADLDKLGQWLPHEQERRAIARKAEAEEKARLAAEKAEQEKADLLGAGFTPVAGTRPAAASPAPSPASSTQTSTDPLRTFRAAVEAARSSGSAMDMEMALAKLEVAEEYQAAGKPASHHAAAIHQEGERRGIERYKTQLGGPSPATPPAVAQRPELPDDAKTLAQHVYAANELVKAGKLEPTMTLAAEIKEARSKRPDMYARQLDQDAPRRAALAASLRQNPNLSAISERAEKMAAGIAGVKNQLAERQSRKNDLGNSM